MGEKVEKFEKSFAEFFGAKYAIMVNSGSSANLLIVAALTLLQKYDFKKGDEIIVPSLGLEHKLYTIYTIWTKIKVCGY